MKETFTISRRLEFFSEGELTKQIGYGQEYWPTVVVAELVDNALDHCEEFEILPEILVSVDAHGISISDNGKGIPSETIYRLADFDTRTSSRLAYASPTRGQQGNASKCLIAVPFVLTGDQGVVRIDCHGTLHTITTTMDHIARNPVIKLETSPGKVQIGTSIELDLPSKQTSHQVARIVSLIEEYAAFNRHASLRLRFFGDEYRWDRTSDTIAKWTPSNPEPAHWYDLQSFEELIAFCIHADRQSGKSRTVRDFISQFSGFKRSDALKEVLDRSGMTRRELGSLADESGINHQLSSTILDAMQAVSEPPKPEKLGVIGKAHFESILGDGLTYKRIADTTAEGMPFVLEAAFKEHSKEDQGRYILSGVNFSVDIDAIFHSSVAELLSNARVYSSCAVDFAIHLTTPNVTYTDRGKTHITLCEKIETALATCIESVTSKYTAKVKAEERRESREWKRKANAPASFKMTLKDAIIQVLPDSIRDLSRNGNVKFGARAHYYNIRPRIQSLCTHDLQQKYLDNVIDDYEKQNGIIEARERDPRGFLLEPHTNKRIPLGTRQVDEYQIPWHRYQAILYVEKKGLLPLFEYGRILERYDTAIICAEGYAVRAGQTLMQNASKLKGMKIIVFHDADPSGYSIADKLGRNSGAHKFDFKIFDAGLRIKEAVAMGLQTERFHRWKALEKNLNLTEEDLRYFGGKPTRAVGKKGKLKNRWVDCQRVELDALACDPDNFVQWVESKLHKYGLKRKLVPPKDHVHKYICDIYQRIKADRIREEIKRQFDFDDMVRSIIAAIVETPDLSTVFSDLNTWAGKLNSSHWTHFCESVVSEQVELLRDRIAELVAKERRGAS